MTGLKLNPSDAGTAFPMIGSHNFDPSTIDPNLTERYVEGLRGEWSWDFRNHLVNFSGTNKFAEIVEAILWFHAWNLIQNQSLWIPTGYACSLGWPYLLGKFVSTFEVGAWPTIVLENWYSTQSQVRDILSGLDESGSVNMVVSWADEDMNIWLWLIAGAVDEKYSHSEWGYRSRTL